MVPGWLLQASAEFPNWVAWPVSLGGFTLLLYLVLSRRLVHPRTYEEMREEKDRQILQAQADVNEWKSAYFHEREAREKEGDARSIAEQRADVAVEAARTVSVAMDALRTEWGRRQHG